MFENNQITLSSSNSPEPIRTKMSWAGEKIIIDSNYVKQNLDELVKDTDLSKFIL